MNLESLLENLRAEIESSLLNLVQERQPAELYDSVQYVIAGGGKRVRPILLLLSANIYGVSTSQAMPLALAVELVHNFSLVHDDIMDHASSRRGRETVHVVWDVETAILCGDVLFALACECVSRAVSGAQAPLTRIFGEMVRVLCEGQARDMVIGNDEDFTTDEYLRMIDGKTGGLIAASLEMGGVVAGAKPSDCSALRQAGVAIGRAFQILDDLLDLIADDHRWGKVQGGDLIEGKGTYLIAEVRRRATGEDAAFFAGIRPGAGLVSEKIPEARTRMEALGVLDDARRQVQSYTSYALTKIDSIQGNTHDLYALINHMGARIY